MGGREHKDRGGQGEAKSGESEHEDQNIEAAELLFGYGGVEMGLDSGAGRRGLHPAVS